MGDAPDGTFALDSVRVGLLELLADPGRDRYRLRAEVRLDNWQSNATHVGIYCLYGHRAVPDGGSVHHYCALSFNDLNIWPERTMTWAELSTQQYVETTPPLPVRRHWAGGPRLALEPAEISDAAGTRWHQIAVEVTPEDVRGFWEGKLIVNSWGNAALSRAKVEESTASMASRLPEPVRVAAPGYDPRSPLGLHVYWGKASFRRVVVEPLD